MMEHPALLALVALMDLLVRARCRHLLKPVVDHCNCIAGGFCDCTCNTSINSCATSYPLRLWYLYCTVTSLSACIRNCTACFNIAVYGINASGFACELPSYMHMYGNSVPLLRHCSAQALLPLACAGYSLMGFWQEHLRHLCTCCLPLCVAAYFPAVCSIGCVVDSVLRCA
jgi:hypothetical protein